MSVDEEKAIEDLEEISHYCSLRAIDINEKYSDLWARYVVSTQKVLNLIKKQQEEIEKKDKIINEMANTFLENDTWWYLFDNNKESIIDYFTKKVGKDNE